MQPAIGDWLISTMDCEPVVGYRYGDLYLVVGYNKCELRGYYGERGEVIGVHLVGERTFRCCKPELFDIRDETGFRTNYAKLLNDPALAFEVSLQLATHGVEL